MTGEPFSAALRTFGFIEAISRFSGSSGAVRIAKECSVEDYVGKITALFSPYISESISERDFSALQKEVRAVVTDIKNGGSK